MNIKARFIAPLLMAGAAAAVDHHGAERIGGRRAYLRQRW